MGEGLSVSFVDLCTPCARTVKNHLEQIGKKLTGPSPDRDLKVTKAAKEPKAQVEEKSPPKKAPDFLPRAEDRVNTFPAK